MFIKAVKFDVPSTNDLQFSLPLQRSSSEASYSIKLALKSSSVVWLKPQYIQFRLVELTKINLTICSILKICDAIPKIHQNDPCTYLNLVSYFYDGRQFKKHSKWVVSLELICICDECSSQFSPHVEKNQLLNMKFDVSFNKAQTARISLGYVTKVELLIYALC